MDSVGAAEAQRRDRIIAHMNHSHTRELTHYLRYFAALSPRHASNPSLRDLTLQGIRIRAAGVDHAIPFTPPLDGWDQVKQRIVDMDATARRHLGISDVFVTSYLRPRLFYLESFTFAGVLFYFACVATLPCVMPARPLWNAIDAFFPGGAERYRWLVRTLFIPVVSLHTVEALLLGRKLQTRCRSLDNLVVALGLELLLRGRPGLLESQRPPCRGESQEADQGEVIRVSTGQSSFMYMGRPAPDVASNAESSCPGPRPPTRRSIRRMSPASPVCSPILRSPSLAENASPGPADPCASRTQVARKVAIGDQPMAKVLANLGVPGRPRVLAVPSQGVEAA